MSGTEILLSEVELIAFLLGSLGLLVPLAWYLRRRKKKPPAPRTSLGIHQKLIEENPWWSALEKSRSRFSLGAKAKQVQELKEALEEACLSSDLGVTNTTEALEKLDWKKILASEESNREHLMKQDLAALLEGWVQTAPGVIESETWPTKLNPTGPTVLWFVGVNGVGKTTSIAKLARELKSRGFSVLLAAGDTFRAAASDQLQTWAERLDVPCIRGADGADSSAVLFDALESARAKKVDFVLCDSAGRLHNNKQLMDSLIKNRKVMNKALEGAPHETLLVLDANTGQNMIKQAETFLADVQVTGLILTKLDGSARGGAVVAVARKTGLPIRRLGLGEKAEQMAPFEGSRFSRALLGLES